MKTDAYSHDGVNLIGHLSRDEAVQGRRPVVLVALIGWLLDRWGLLAGASRGARKHRDEGR
jgi:hypothetical protein